MPQFLKDIVSNAMSAILVSAIIGTSTLAWFYFARQAELTAEVCRQRALEQNMIIDLRENKHETIILMSKRIIAMLNKIPSENQDEWVAEWQKLVQIHQEELILAKDVPDYTHPDVLEACEHHPLNEIKLLDSHSREIDRPGLLESLQGG